MHWWFPYCSLHVFLGKSFAAFGREVLMGFRGYSHISLGRLSVCGLLCVGRVRVKGILCKRGAWLCTVPCFSNYRVPSCL